MPLSQEHPDYAYALRAADGRHAKVNEQILQQSFILMPDELVERWPVQDLEHLQASHMDAVLALTPAVILLGTGERQRFPNAQVLAACLTRGIGLEAMTNAAAARTYNVLASEGRRVALAMVLPG
ncbi:Mth938-like domain-containing protein [Xanthomonas nasturtii]|uniref:Mth938-like domain-containing protein n=1 Tax=Xanthomonas TaxID=338 RepID=UPI000E1EE990|nr:MULTISPECIES: Mth938-like domain-containing protein [Xanthomonas]MEA9556476.1 Mth938-like domain-containing protein [Xanthomonas nasturtii]MEA9565040.1 Mth938-like domain-containing protein [Xanthomonas sp. WHRI 8932A]MEA9578031.1 Mth938-like domain-containing protein [Xanthomonas nasturtii]MEA9588108.1 Mth938-like domain-containing protein [Xanthomonas sp. WHRI 10064B]MEA9615830.1 Mth938-like domain-containing protein [Xanthomonas sp. WHRI 10064A]